MTQLSSPVTLGAERAWPRTAQTLAAGLLGGFALGVVARAWMRLISEDPEFTWSGTLFIVLGFTFFGLTQAIAALARRVGGRWILTIARAFGVAGMLPLFVAAGALGFPTVIGGGLAFSRVNWHRLTRVIGLIVAALPVLYVGNDLVDSFGWSRQSLAGIVGMLAVYGTIIWATQFTLAPRADGRRWARWARITVPLVLALFLIVAVIQGGGIT